MGANTPNGFFYLPALAATGQTEKDLFDAALIATDASIQALIDAAAASNLKSNFVAGENLVQFDNCYMKSDGKMYKCDADDETKILSAGIANATINADATGVFVTHGEITNAGWSFTIGGKVYVSTTNGELTQTPPSGSGDFVMCVGVAVSATKISYRPANFYMGV